MFLFFFSLDNTFFSGLELELFFLKIAAMFAGLLFKNEKEDNLVDELFPPPIIDFRDLSLRDLDAILSTHYLF